MKVRHSSVLNVSWRHGLYGLCDMSDAANSASLIVATDLGEEEEGAVAAAAEELEEIVAS